MSLSDVLASNSRGVEFVSRARVAPRSIVLRVEAAKIHTHRIGIVLLTSSRPKQRALTCRSVEVHQSETDAWEHKGKQK